MGPLVEFRPRPETVQLHDALALYLDEFDRRVKTSNNIPTKTLAESHLMPLFLALHQWVMALNTDVAEYMNAIASQLGGEGAGFDDDDFDTIATTQEYLEELRKFVEVSKDTLPPNLVELLTKSKDLAIALADILEGAGGEEEDDNEPLFAEDAVEEPKLTEEVTK